MPVLESSSGGLLASKSSPTSIWGYGWRGGALLRIMTIAAWNANDPHRRDGNNINNHNNKHAKLGIEW